MTIIWLICYCFSGCPNFIDNSVEHRAWFVTLAICAIIDVCGGGCSLTTTK